MKRILVTLLILLVLVTSCMGDPNLKIGSTGTITGTVKDASYQEGNRVAPSEVYLVFEPVGAAKSISWQFDYSGENTLLANLMLIKEGDTVTITYKRI